MMQIARKDKIKYFDCEYEVIDIYDHFIAVKKPDDLPDYENLVYIYRDEFLNVRKV